MGSAAEGLAALLAALGLALLGGILFGRLLCPAPGGAQWLLIPGRGDGAGLEQTVRAAMWLRGLGLLRCPVAIVDAGLNEQGRRLAAHLAGRWGGVRLCTAKQLYAVLRLNGEE